MLCVGVVDLILHPTHILRVRKLRQSWKRLAGRTNTNQGVVVVIITNNRVSVFGGSMKIRIGFSYTNTLISRIIRKLTKSEVSHTYIRLYDTFLEADLLFHADWNGIVFVQTAEFEKNNVLLEEFELDDPRLAQAIKQNLRRLGHGYDYLRLFGFTWVVIFRRWMSKKINNSLLRDPKKMICTQFVCRVLNDSGMFELPEHNLDPKLLLEWFRKNHKNYVSTSTIENIE